MLRHVVGMVVAMALAGGVSGQENVPAGEARRHYLLGTQHEARRELDAAAQAYARRSAWSPDWRSRTIGWDSSMGFRVERLMRSREFERARECDPGLFDAHYHLGATLWWTGDHERALDALRIAVRCGPSTPRHATTSACR